jgi:uncharacterized protein
MDEMQTASGRLWAWLEALDSAKVAVSGGVDSMTLALIAGRVLGERAQVFHARSPAVPDSATRRVREMARREGWVLHLVDAGELRDKDYLSNPYRRCFYCKNRLYQALSTFGAGTLLSGTNVDDLGDFRPGLEAAADHGVRHPFVECGVDKAGVRRICRQLGYAELSELPASPCLSSRIETGIQIQPAVLLFVDRVESALRVGLPADVVRCRVRPGEIAVQLDAAVLSGLSPAHIATLTSRIRDQALPLGLPAPVRFEPYRMGSAFVPDH